MPFTLRERFYLWCAMRKHLQGPRDYRLAGEVPPRIGLSAEQAKEVKRRWNIPESHEYVDIKNGAGQIIARYRI